MNEPTHVPVLAERTLELLLPALTAPNALFIDATLGLGGHSEGVLTSAPQAHVVGIDRDGEALERSRVRLGQFSDRFDAVHAVYDEIEHVLSQIGRDRADAVLFDAGVSSMQLDSADRGFAYAVDAPLDMRMDPTSRRTAADVLNSASVGELTRILAVYGQEKFARRIAQAVVAARTETHFHTSAQLVSVIRQAVPAPARRTGGNPAKRTFQALRIEVNDELATLARALPAALAALTVGGRVVALAYHSGEDRIAKRAFAEVTESAAPRDLPVIPDELRPRFRSLTRGAETASDDEIAANPRAQSVRLRAVERTAA